MAALSQRSLDHHVEEHRVAVLGELRAGRRGGPDLLQRAAQGDGGRGVVEVEVDENPWGVVGDPGTTAEDHVRALLARTGSPSRQVLLARALGS